MFVLHAGELCTAWWANCNTALELFVFLCCDEVTSLHPILSFFRFCHISPNIFHLPLRNSTPMWVVIIAQTTLIPTIITVCLLLLPASFITLHKCFICVLYTHRLTTWAVVLVSISSMTSVSTTEWVPVSYLLRYLPLSVALVTCSTVLVIRYVIILYYSIVLQFKRLKLLLSCLQYQMNLFSLAVDLSRIWTK